MSSLLGTLALLLANYDDQRDYLSNFEQFVLDRLKAWPSDEPVNSKQLREALAEAFSLPPIPINTVTLLRDRVHEQGYLKLSTSRKLMTVPARLAVVPDLSAERTEVLGHFTALADSLRAYAKAVHELDWSAEDANGALERFVEGFGIEMAMAKRDGSLANQQEADEDQALSVVHAFARHALEREPTSMKYLEEMVKGSMLANVLYFQDQVTPLVKLDDLVVYLDTRVAFRVLGLCDDELAAGEHELMELLRQFNVPVRIFDHTVQEMIAVLEGVAQNLRLVHAGQLDLEQLARQGQEVLLHAVRSRWDPSDVHEIVTTLDQRLGVVGIVPEPTPRYTRRLTLDEKSFEQALRYQREEAAAKDVLSVSAIFRLRDGQPSRDLSRTRAIFVTTNNRLVAVTRRFMRSQGKESKVPLCVGDLSFTTQLWLRSAGEHRSIPRKLLIAESFAALNPSPELWSRFLDKVAVRRDAGEITSEQVHALIFTIEGREGLVNVTRGDPERIDEDTPFEVLKQYEDALRRPVEERAAQVEQELQRLRDENTDLLEREEAREARLATQERQLHHHEQTIASLKDAHEQQRKVDQARAERRASLRRAAGILTATLVVLAAAGLRLVNAYESPALVALVGFAATLFAAMMLAWALRRSWTWALRAVGAVGTFLALFFGIYGMAQRDSGGTRLPQAHSGR
ncbi:MAG TPA: hypothetical protein VE972_05930 [Conexibacter sp.]|nr:hypothetical protein [Conexibacter sp.]